MPDGAGACKSVDESESSEEENGMNAGEGCPRAAAKKHPCPDCACCQWCSERRCDMCQGWLTRPADAGHGKNENETREPRKENDESE